MAGLTLGSLFDGIGVFPLNGSRYGIIPTWASEVESAYFYYKKAFSQHVTSRRYYKDRWWKDNTCSYYYLWFSLSEIIEYWKER